MQFDFITQMLNLKRVNDNSTVKIYIASNTREHTCPVCGDKTFKLHNLIEQTPKIWLFSLNTHSLYPS